MSKQQKRSSVASKVPLATDLEVGQIALNFPDQKIYTKDGSNNIIELSPQLTDAQVRALFSAGGDLSYNSTTGEFSITASGGYADSDVDTHLNTSSASTNQVLSWNGTDYVWADQTAGAGYDDGDVAAYISGNNTTDIAIDGNIETTEDITAGGKFVVNASTAPISAFRANNQQYINQTGFPDDTNSPHIEFTLEDNTGVKQLAVVNTCYSSTAGSHLSVYSGLESQHYMVVAGNSADFMNRDLDFSRQSGDLRVQWKDVGDIQLDDNVEITGDLNVVGDLTLSGSYSPSSINTGTIDASQLTVAKDGSGNGRALEANNTQYLAGTVADGTRSLYVDFSVEDSTGKKQIAVFDCGYDTANGHDFGVYGALDGTNYMKLKADEAQFMGNGFSVSKDGNGDVTLDAAGNDITINNLVGGFNGGSVANDTTFNARLEAKRPSTYNQQHISNTNTGTLADNDRAGSIFFSRDDGATANPTAGYNGTKQWTAEINTRYSNTGDNAVELNIITDWDFTMEAAALFKKDELQLFENALTVEDSGNIEFTSNSGDFKFNQTVNTENRLNARRASNNVQLAVVNSGTATIADGDASGSIWFARDDGATTNPTWAGNGSYHYNAEINATYTTGGDNSVQINLVNDWDFSKSEGAKFRAESVEFFANTGKLEKDGNDIDVVSNTGNVKVSAEQLVMPNALSTDMPVGVAGGMVMVSDQSYKPAYFDGTDWRYVSDNTTV